MKARRFGHHAEAVTLQIGVDRRVIEVQHPVPAGPALKLACEHHPVDVGAVDPGAPRRRRTTNTRGREPDHRGFAIRATLGAQRNGPVTRTGLI